MLTALCKCPQMVMVVPLWMHYPSRLRDCEVTLLYTKGHKKEDTAPTLLRGSDFIHLLVMTMTFFPLSPYQTKNRVAMV